MTVVILMCFTFLLLLNTLNNIFILSQFLGIRSSTVASALPRLISTIHFPVTIGLLCVFCFV